MGQGRDRIPYLGIHLLAGFGCFLTYLLLLRVLRIQYVYHYVPQITNPVLFTPAADIVVWAVTFLILCYAQLFAHWRMPESRRNRRSIVFAVVAVMIITVPFLVVDLTPWFVLSYLVPFIHLSYRPLKGLNRHSGFLVSTLAALGICLLVEVASVIVLFSSMLGAKTLSLGFGRQILETTIHLTYAIQHYSVQFLAVIVFSCILFPVLLSTRGKTRFPGGPIQFSSMGPFVLLLSVVLSAIAISIRFLGDTGLYGVDTGYYLDILKSTGDFRTLFNLLSSDPRVIYLLLLQFLTVFGVTPELAIKTGPLILMALNSCAMYGLGSELAQDRFVGGLVGMFSALGVQTSTSLYAGVYANWFAMFFAAFAFALYLRAVRTGNRLLLASPIFLVVVSCLVHPWSGIVVSFILVFASLLDSVFLRKRGASFLVAVLLFAASIATFLVASYVFSSHHGMLGRFEPLYSAFHTQNLHKVIPNLSYTMDYMVGGFMSAPIYYLTSLVGCLLLYKSELSSSGYRFLFVYLAASSIPLLFAEQWIQWRLIYLMPIALLSGLGLYYVSSLVMSAKTKLNTSLVLVLLCTVLVALLNYMLCSVNFLPSL